MKGRGIAAIWRDRVLKRDGYRCQSEPHDPGCWKVGCRFEAHHIVFKSHLTKPTRYLVENGITLSIPCHRLAHSTHNANIDRVRLDAAVDAVNAKTDPTKPELRRPYFAEKVAV